MFNTIKEIIVDHKAYKKQILKLAKADLNKTYRTSALGWAWAVIKPAVTIFIYWFAFSFGLRGQGNAINGYPFFFWLIAGLTPWFYISDMLTQGTDSIKKNRYLVTKMKFPVSTIPTFTSLSKLFVNLLLLGIVILIFVFCGYPIDIYYIQLPFYILLMYMFFTGWTLFGAPIAAISADFSNLVKSMITAVFWLSGLLWNPESLSIPWLKWILYFNPVTYLSEGFRDCLIYKRWFFESPQKLLIFLFLLLLMWLLAVWSYRKTRKEMPDVL